MQEVEKKSEFPALIRRCDGCHRVTAIDMDNTPRHKTDMQLLGQTVFEVTEDDAKKSWNGAGPCLCDRRTALAELIADSESHLATLEMNRIFDGNQDADTMRLLMRLLKHLKSTCK